MATTTTLKTLLEEILETTGLGFVLGTVTGATTGWTASTSYVKGPFNTQRIPRGSPILATAGGAINENSYVDTYTPSSGAGTVEPDFSTTWTDGVIAYLDPKGIDHIDRVKEALNRALQNRLGRWEPRPLTYVPDGDMQGATVTDYWTAAANGTAAYASAQVYPAGSAADAVGQVGLNRVVQLTTSGGASTLTGNGIRVVLSNQQRAWRFLTAIRLVSGTGTVEFKVRDNTNSADISLDVSRGNDTQTLTTTTLGDFLVCEGTFQLPATCAEIAPQLSLSATGMVAQMGPVIMFPLNTYSFPMANRVEFTERIENFRYAVSRYSPGGLADILFTDPITVEGMTHRLQDFGDHLTVQFNFPVNRPIYYDEYVPGAALTALTDTTTFPKERVLRWARYELYEYLRKKDNRWLGDRNTALRTAMRADAASVPVETVYGRV